MSKPVRSRRRLLRPKIVLTIISLRALADLITMMYNYLAKRTKGVFYQFERESAF